MIGNGWELKMSKINLYNIDCMEFMKDKPDDYYDGAFTSPPYNANLKVSGGRYTTKTSWKNFDNGANKYENYTDNLSMDKYYEWQNSVIFEMLRICKGNIFYNIQILGGNKTAIFRIFGRYADVIKDVIIWDKINTLPSICLGALNADYEMVIIFNKNSGMKRSFDNYNFKRGEESNIIRVDRNRKSNNQHRASMPVKFCEKVLSLSLKKGNTIIDPFGGLMTTAIAGHNLKLNVDLCELDEDYFKAGKDRLDKHQQQLTFNF